VADILTTIRLQADQYLQEGKKVEDQLRSRIELEQAEGKQVNVTNAELAKAAKERAALLVKEKQTLADLEKLKKAAFNPKEIELYNSAIAKTNANINTLKGVSGGVEKQNSLLSSSFAKLGGAIVAAFSVQQIIAFGEASFKAFTEAEKTAKLLQTAVGVNGGLQKDFDALIEQSKQLEATSIFSDDDIQKAQTMALQFGLTNKQVKALLPTIVDFASATNQSLDGALETVLHGTTGMAKGLKIYGIEVDSTATKSQNLASITQQLNDKFSNQADVVGKTAFGAVERFKNKFNNFQEDIGGFINDVAGATLSIIDWIGRGFKPLDDQLDSTASKLGEVGKKISSALPKALIQQQIAQLTALNEAVPQDLIAALKQFNLDDFNAEIESLDDKGLIKKLKDIESETVKFSRPGTLTIKERLDVINQEVAARKAAGKLLAEQDKVDDSQLKKAHDERIRELNERKQAQETFRKFALQSILDGITERETTLKEQAAKEITNKQDLEARIFQIEQEANQERKQTLIDFQESIADINKKIADSQINFNQKNAEEDLKATLQTIDASTKAEIAAIEKSFNEKKDFSEEATKKKDDAIFTLEIQGAVAKDKEILKSSTATDEQRLAAEADLNEKLGQLYGKDAENFKVNQQRKRDEAVAVLQAVGDASNEIDSLLQANSDAEIERINTRKDANNDAIDAQINKLEEQHQKGRIGDEAFEKRKKELIASRLTAEKNYNEQVKVEKRKQAGIDKAVAIFNIILNTAAAIVKALPNVFLAGLAGATGAIQLAIAIATPIPAFAKGTKGKKDTGLALVGERGPELVHLPQGAKVLPNNRTRQYGQFIDAMYDGNLDAFINRKYVQPAIRNNVNVNFNERNIVRAIRESDRDSIKIENIHELAELFQQPNLRRAI
jgi:hypothetical protein